MKIHLTIRTGRRINLTGSDACIFSNFKSYEPVDDANVDSAFILKEYDKKQLNVMVQRIC